MTATTAARDMMFKANLSPTPRQVDALAADLRLIVEDERRTLEDAVKVLRSRIGGLGNLEVYVATLTRRPA